MNNENERHLIEIFIDESREHLEGFEMDLLTIERDGGAGAPELIDKVFRAIHTIKGSAGFFGLQNIKLLSHHMESVLGKIRAGKCRSTPLVISALLSSADTLRRMVATVDTSEQMEIGYLIEELETIEAAAENETTPEGNFTVEKGLPNIECTSSAYGITITVAPVEINRVIAENRGKFTYLLEIDATKDVIANKRSETSLIKEIETVATVIEWQGDRPVAPERYAIVSVSSLVKSVLAELLVLPVERVHLLFTGTVAPQESSSTAPPLSDAAEPHADRSPDNTHEASAIPEAEKSRSVQSHTNALPAITVHETSLRVAIGTLDRLMTLAGEMVLTRNELLQNLSTKNLHRIQVVSQKVDAITSELQEAIMSTRMLSVGVVLGKFRRFVRDGSMQLGKQIHLDIKGEEVELDKSIVEAIADPLTHIVRNAIDHGIEKPEVRLRAGKQAVGTLRIKATHEAGHVLLEIADDGKGIDPAIIRSKARALGFADDTSLAAMNDAEVIKFIFKPGFSTAETVTELSGRGVGMDVVQSNLKRVGGSVDIDSVPGKGTTLRIKLPLTLAIIPALLVCVEDERYAIPQSNIEELVRIPAADVKYKIESIGSAAVLRLRGELLPLVHLCDILGMEKTYIEHESGTIMSDRRLAISDRRSGKKVPVPTDDDKRGTRDRRVSHESARNIVVVAAGDFRYGIIADALLDSAEIVVKPLGYHLYDCREYAGATILGDGHVALILDVMGIRRLLEVRIDTGAVQREKEHQTMTNNTTDVQSFLIVEYGKDDYFAIPVGLICRIDKIRESSISMTGGKQVAYYRGTMVRLFEIGSIVKVPPRTSNDSAYMVMVQACGRELAILASEIIDTVDIPATAVDCITHVQPGIIGTAYVKDRFTLIIDVFGMVKLCAPELFLPDATIERKHTAGSVLIVEDSPFFRRQICSFIEDAGYATISCENGAQALSFLKNGSKKIDIVLTDIEMPEMNGLELTRAIRGDVSLNTLPVIALTSVSGEAAERKGRDAGVNEYLIKFERQAVLNACKTYITSTTTPLREETICIRE